MVVSIEHMLRHNSNLPSNPGGGQLSPPSESIEKITVSHQPLGHSLLSGEANSLLGGVGIGECLLFVWTLTECHTLTSLKGALAFQSSPLLPEIMQLS